MTRLIPLLLLFSTLANGAVELNWYGAVRTGIHLQTNWQMFSNPPVGEAASGSARVITSGALLVADAYCLASTAEAPLANIPTGNYRVWIKANCYDRFNKGNIAVAARAGGGSASTVMFDTDKDANWASIGVIDVPSPIDRISLQFWATNTALGLNLYPLTVHAVYLSDDLNVAMASAGYLQLWNLSSATDATAPVAGNYMYNSSFELEPGGTGITIFSNDGRQYSLDDCVRTGDAWHGSKYLSVIFKRCDAIQPFTWVNFPIVRLRADKAHTLSVYARATSTPATLQLALRNPVPVPAGYGFPAQPIVQSATYTLTTNWARYQLANQIMRAYPYADFSPEAFCSATAGARVELDGFLLQEGTAPVAWTPANNRELVMDAGGLANILYAEDGDPVIKFHVAEYQTSGSDTINYRIFRDGAFVTNGAVGITTLSGAVTNTSVTFPGAKYGQYRVEATLASGGRTTEGQFMYIHTPRDIPVGKRVIGTDPSGLHFLYQMLGRLGIRSVRQLSPGTFYRWNIFEATPDVYTYLDAFHEASVQYGWQVIGNLYQNLSIPSGWPLRTLVLVTNVSGTGYVSGETLSQAGTGASGTITWISPHTTPGQPLIGGIQLTNATGVFTVAGGTITGGTSGTTSTGAGLISGACQALNTLDLGRYSNYVRKVTAYYTNIWGWEIWNEPSSTFGANIAGDLGMGFYAMSTIMSADAIKASNPNAKVVGLGGATIGGSTIIMANTLWNFLPTATRNKIDSVSYHIYPDAGSYAVSTADWAAGIGKESYDSETGFEDVGSRLGWQSPIYYYGRPVQGYSDVQLKLRGIAATPRMISTNIMAVIGAGHERYYYYDCRVFHTAKILKEHYTMLDGDDTFLPKAATLAWYEYIMGGGAGTGKKPIGGTPADVDAYGFSNPDTGTDWIFLFSIKGKKNLSWSLTSSQVQVHDLFGNVIPTTGTDIPFGLGGVCIKGVGVSAASMATALLLGSVSTVADTTPPKLMFMNLPVNPLTALDKHYQIVRWISFDDVSIAQPQYPDVQQYRYRINAGAWQPWTTQTSVEFINAAAGTYTIDVEARDEALNTDAITGNLVIP